MFMKSDFFNNNNLPTQASKAWVDKEKFLDALSHQNINNLLVLLENKDAIDLSEASISLEGLNFLTQQINQNVIKRLHMNACAFDDDNADSLVLLVKSLPHLTLATFNHNDLTENTALELLKAFNTHPSLLRLELKENKIDTSVFALKEQDIISEQFQQALEKAMQYFLVKSKKDLTFKRDFPKGDTQIIF